MIEGIGVALAITAALRLFDIACPTKWWPWQAYAVQLAIAIGMIVIAHK